MARSKKSLLHCHRRSTKPCKSDRLSQLPDAVLHHILYFAGARQAVQTSLLSRRWRHTWSTMPNLIFEPVEYPFERSASLIDNVMNLHRGSEMNRIHLTVFHPSCTPLPNSRFSAWIRRAAWRNVRELCLSITSQCYDYLHPLLADFRSLQVLRLSVPYPGISSLPKFSTDSCGLRILSISGMLNCGEYSLQDIVDSCPALEELSVSVGEFKSVSISSDQLKKLVVSHCWPGDRKIIISTPSLVCLDNTNEAYDCHLEKMDNVATSSICIDCSSNRSVGVFKLMIGSLTNVHALTLAGSLLETCLIESAMENFLESLPTFHRMKHMRVFTRTTKVYPQAMAKFLQHMPNLQTLVIQKGHYIALRYAVDIDDNDYEEEDYDSDEDYEDEEECYNNYKEEEEKWEEEEKEEEEEEEEENTSKEEQEEEEDASEEEEDEEEDEKEIKC